MVELSVLGISLQQDGGTPLLLLHPHGTQRILCLRIGPMEAFAISDALHGAAKPAAPSSDVPPSATSSASGTSFATPGSELFPRPQAHDLLLNCILALGGTLVSVDILRLVDGAFIAEAVIDHPGGRARVDCRPSDGVALALRCGGGVGGSDAVAAHAEEMDAVMAALPDYVRTVAAAKLALPKENFGAPGRMVSGALKEALEAGGRTSEADGDIRDLISVARKMLMEEDAPRPQEAPATGRERIKLFPPKVKAVPRMPQIRVSLVRHKKGGETEIVDEFHIPSTGLPKDVIASLGLSGREAEALSSASDEDRWATLLRLLSPETKVLM